MKKLIGLLVAGTLALGGIALYERHESHERAPSLPTTPAAAPAGTVNAPPPEMSPSGTQRPAPARTNDAARNPALATLPTTSVPSGAAAKPASLSPRAREQAEQFLGRYANPATRGALLALMLPSTRESLEGFDQERRIDAATLDKLVRLVAEHELTARAMYYRCTLYSECDAWQHGDIQNRYMEAVDALIGQNGYNHAVSWIQSNPSRRVVRSFSSHLPVPLTTAQSNALLDELDPQRGIYMHGYSRSGQRFAPFVDGNGTEVLFSWDARTLDEQMASARAYSRHIRGLAANVLTGEQLRTFNRLQDAALRALPEYLRETEADRRDGS